MFFTADMHFQRAIIKEFLPIAADLKRTTALGRHFDMRCERELEKRESKRDSERGNSWDRSGPGGRGQCFLVKICLHAKNMA